MTALAEFLLARIAEDEHQLDLPEYEVVLNSHGEVSARGDGWVTRGECPVCGAYQFDGTESVTEEAWWDHAEKVHQRARVLAECEAKRAIIETRQLVDAHIRQIALARPEEAGDARNTRAGLDVAIAALALPYADHPDYREEWRP